MFGILPKLTTELVNEQNIHVSDVIAHAANELFTPYNGMGQRGLLCQYHPNIVKMLASNVFYLADKTIHIYWNERQLLCKVADIFKACKYDGDVNNFFNRHKSKRCKSWKKGPQACWYCDVNDLCDIASRTDEGKKWLARMVDAHVSSMMNKYVALYFVIIILVNSIINKRPPHSIQQSRHFLPKCHINNTIFKRNNSFQLYQSHWQHNILCNNHHFQINHNHNTYKLNNNLNSYQRHPFYQLLHTIYFPNIQ